MSCLLYYIVFLILTSNADRYETLDEATVKQQLQERLRHISLRNENYNLENIAVSNEKF